MNNNVSPFVSLPSAGWEDFLIVMGAIVLVALMAFIWIAFSPKKRTHLHRHHRRHHGKSRKKRRRERRKLNPTLAETGGLPPIRQEEKFLPGQTPAPPPPP
ncbi:MAG TPA: hypothetical protein VGH42_04980 [Verrucomicrobiae bacterium]|jgi:hypothetical protein